MPKYIVRIERQAWHSLEIEVEASSMERAQSRLLNMISQGKVAQIPDVASGQTLNGCAIEAEDMQADDESPWEIHDAWETPAS